MRFMDRATFRDIGDGLRAQPGRAGLAFFAITVGMISLTALVAILGGLEARARSILHEFGVNVFALHSSSAPTESGAVVPLDARHAALLAANLQNCDVVPMRAHEVALTDAAAPITVVATTERLSSLRQWRRVEGRFLDARDVRDHARVAMVSRALARQFNWKVGDMIQLRQVPVEVIGVIEIGGGAAEEGTMDTGITLGPRCLFVPLDLPPYWLQQQVVPDRGALDTVFVRSADGERLGRNLATAQQLMAQPDLSTSEIEWITPDTLLRGVNRMRHAMRWAAGGIVVLCLILGGTTLMSLMVANVRDRVTEIGLRRALGATAADVSRLFVIEACVITAAAAVTGALVTHILLLATGRWLPLPLHLGPGAVFIPILVALLLGALFSYWPARAAARIAPSEALRND